MKTIKLGYTGNEVQILSSRLKSNGYSIDSNTEFTDTIKDSVIKFQRANGLDSDGIVGYCTWEKLLFAGQTSSIEIKENDYFLLSLLLDCEIAALKAVQKVETNGRGGFFAPGKPAILFEGHIFWSQLQKKGINPNKYVAGNEDILYPKWDKKHYKGGIKEYERLEQARKIDYEAANASASWGMFQIMGFNHAACGEKDVESFVKSMHESECKQLILFGRFIRNSKMLFPLQAKDWADFAKRYNGPCYSENQYDIKLATAYKSFSSK